MIPKIIHYCWISGEENMPEDIKSCIASWHKYLPDYQFINWNDSNFDWNICEFTKHCRENNLYAFCSDYIRFWALYNYGGIYLDSDVTVYKSFNELLKLKRIITKENSFLYNDFIEAAIMGCEKGDIVFKDLLDWYNNTDKQFSKQDFIVCPEIIRDIWKEKYTLKNIDDLKDEVNTDSVISVLNFRKYFDHYENPESYAQHQFKSSWGVFQSSKDISTNDKCKIFLCAHKPIENYIPRNKKYVIIDVTGKVDNSYNDNFHEILNISNDDFVKNHNVCYGEGCVLKYLYTHPEILPDYVCCGHYRRYFIEFAGVERHIPRVVDEYNAIIKTPYNFTTKRHKTNISIANWHHNKKYIDILISSIRELYPDFYKYFTEFANDKYFYACNCFAMKKEDFLEMCEICFNILNNFDRKLKFKNNDDVLKDLINLSHTHHLFWNLDWQRRLQGFLLEYLTDSYYRYKWGVDNCYKSELGAYDKSISMCSQAI